MDPEEWVAAIFVSSRILTVPSWCLFQINALRRDNKMGRIDYIYLAREKRQRLKG